MSGKKRKKILQNKIPILSFEYLKKKVKNTKTVYIVFMFE